MKYIRGIDIRPDNREEILPGFSPDFPYIATYAEMDKYIEPRTPWHWHRTVELFYLQSGTLEYTTPRGKWVFQAGTGGFLNSNVLHASRVIPSGDGTIQLLHLFDPVLLSGEQGSRMEAKYILPVTASEVEMLPLDPNIPEQAVILREIRQAFDISGQEWGDEFRLREALTGIWLKLFELIRPQLDREQNGRDSDDKIKTLMVYIHEHYREPISVDQLAEAVHVSRRACFRLFQENLHMTPVEYMRSFRLQKACQLLAKTREPITEIAYSCGLGSSSYFGKVFREQFGCTPAQFRSKWHDRDSSGQISDSICGTIPL